MTIKEFASKLGVSIATVSRAFSGHGRISEATQREVIAKAREWGYRANIHASSLITRSTNTIALFYPSLGYEEPDYFITEIMLGVSSALAECRKKLQIHPFATGASDIELDTYRDYLGNGSFEGIIVVAGARGSNELVSAAKSCDVPCVVIGHMSGVENNSVLFDTEYGAYTAGKYFRDTGRRHPAYIGGVLDKRKRDGFQRGLGAMNNEVIFIEGGNGFRHGGQALENLLQAHPSADCVLCANDVLAMGLIKAATGRGLRVPEDLAVIGFDDIKPARYFSPSLSSVSLRLPELGARAVKILMQAIREDGPIASENVDCDLVLRQSS